LRRKVTPGKDFQKKKKARGGRVNFFDLPLNLSRRGTHKGDRLVANVKSSWCT